MYTHNWIHILRLVHARTHRDTDTHSVPLSLKHTYTHTKFNSLSLYLSLLLLLCLHFSWLSYLLHLYHLHSLQPPNLPMNLCLSFSLFPSWCSLSDLFNTPGLFVCLCVCVCVCVSQESQQWLGRLIPDKQCLNDQLKQVQQNSLHSKSFVCVWI